MVLTNVISLTQEIKKLIEELDDKDRQADSSIKGFFYQIDVTLKRILNDEDCKEFCIEKIEDILELGNVANDGNYINIVQVKNHERETTDSTYYKPIAYFYLSFLKIKEKQLEDKFRFTLLKYDKSESKNVKSIINDVLNISKDKSFNSLRSKIKVLEQKVNINQNKLMDEFYRLVSFIDMGEYSNLVKENINKLKEIFNCTYDVAENYYGFLWVYIKKNFFEQKMKASISKKVLLEELKNNINDITEFLLDENWRYMKDIIFSINKKLNSIEETVKDSNGKIGSIEKITMETLETTRALTSTKADNLCNLVYRCIASIKDRIIGYECERQIYKDFTAEDIFCHKILDEIQEFIKSNINSDYDVKYFLVSISSKYASNGELEKISNKDIDYEKNVIESYIVRLSQIYYFRKYIKEDATCLKDLIYIDDKKIWHIRFKHEDKGDVYVSLLGGIGHDPTNRCLELSSILRKYDNFYRDKYPDLMLYNNKGKKGYVSKLEISKYKDDGNTAHIKKVKRNIAKIDRDIFIKCLGCMEEDDFEEYKKIANLFKFECGGV